MEYKAEDYIDFIESGRHDKISPHGLELIASRFRELEQIKTSKLDIIEELVNLFPNDIDLGSYIRKLVNSEREKLNLGS
jgi:hypothetical protein